MHRFHLLLLLICGHVQHIMALALQLLSSETVETFRRDGVVMVKGLLSGPTLIAAQEFAQHVADMENGAFTGGAHYKNLAFDSITSSRELRDVAMFSDIPKAAAQLILATKAPSPMANMCTFDRMESDRIRLLKDAVLIMGPKNKGCGWHVDDKFFWPCYDDATGINAWIALSPMTAKDGGGLAVAPGSHKLSWCEDALKIIRTGGTCELETLAPTLHEKFEEIKVVWDMSPGDVILHDRWCWHRGDPIKSHAKGENTLPLNRYSVRYMPEDARAYDNGMEAWCQDKFHKGKDGFALKTFGSYFPQVHPTTIKSELDAFK